MHWNSSCTEKFTSALQVQKYKYWRISAFRSNQVNEDIKYVQLLDSIYLLVQKYHTYVCCRNPDAGETTAQNYLLC